MGPVRRQSGLTLLELMIVIAIIGVVVYVLNNGYRSFTKAELTESVTELVSFLRRGAQLSLETGEQHRILFDLDKGVYVMEVCQGSATVARNAQLNPDEDEVKRAAEKGKDRLRDMPADVLAAGDPDEAAKRAISLAGHHIGDRTCGPVTSGTSGIVRNRRDQARDGETEDNAKQWMRTIGSESGVKFKEIWVQHQDHSATKGQIAIYFFPDGSSEKAVIEVADGDTIRSVLVHALTGRIEERNGKLRSIDDHMLRNAMGGRDKQRESEK